MIINPYFKLRFSAKNRLKASVVCEIKINGEKAVPFATGVYVSAKKWNYENLRIEGSDAKTRTDNNTLDRIYTDIIRICEVREIQGLPISATIVKKQYTKKQDKAPQLIELIRQYVKTRQERGLSDGTINQYNCYINLFKRFFESKNRTDIAIAEFSPELYNQLIVFSKRGVQSQHILLVFVKSFLRYAVRNEYVDKHHLIEKENVKGKSKPLVWLNIEQVQTLIDKRYKLKAHEDMRKAFIFQCFTGLSYREIETFSKAKNIKKLMNKDAIVLFRKKTDSYFPVPLLKQAKDILEQIEDGFCLKTNDTYNNFLRYLCEEIEYDDIAKISSHVGRKTAGFFLLNNGVSIEVVSAILGHKSISTTQRVYASILFSTIDKQTAHLQ